MTHNLACVRRVAGTSQATAHGHGGAHSRTLTTRRTPPPAIGSCPRLLAPPRAANQRSRRGAEGRAHACIGRDARGRSLQGGRQRFRRPRMMVHMPERRPNTPRACHASSCCLTDAMAIESPAMGQTLEFPFIYSGIPYQNFPCFSSSGFNSTGFRSKCFLRGPALHSFLSAHIPCCPSDPLDLSWVERAGAATASTGEALGGIANCFCSKVLSVQAGGCRSAKRWRRAHHPPQLPTRTGGPSSRTCWKAPVKARPYFFGLHARCPPKFPYTGPGKAGGGNGNDLCRVLLALGRTSRVTVVEGPPALATVGKHTGQSNSCTAVCARTHRHAHATRTHTQTCACAYTHTPRVQAHPKVWHIRKSVCDRHRANPGER